MTLGSVLSEAASLGVCSPAARSLWREPSRGGAAECRTGRPYGLPRGRGFRGACRGERARGGERRRSPAGVWKRGCPASARAFPGAPGPGGLESVGGFIPGRCAGGGAGGEQGCKHLAAAAANESALLAAPLLRAPHPAAGANGGHTSRPAWAAPEGACGPNSLRPGRPWASRRAFRSRRAKPRPAPGRRRCARSECSTSRSCSRRPPLRPKSAAVPCWRRQRGRVVFPPKRTGARRGPLISPSLRRAP